MEEKRIQLSEKEITESFTLGEICQKYQKQIYFALGGLVLLGILVLLFLSPRQEPAIQIISSEEENKGTIFVDLEGEIEKPGVYEMPAGSRLNDLLVRSGGLSAKADREWVTTNLNLAQKLVDGGKIYIPSSGERTKEQESGKVAGKTTESKINLNRASLAELDNLQGIGVKRAADIIKNRPYQTVEELIKRKIIPQSIYDKIKDEVVVY